MSSAIARRYCCPQDIPLIVVALLGVSSIDLPEVRADEPTAEARVNVTPEQIQQWITQLGDDDFQIREDAQKALRRTGEMALAALQEVNKQTDAEVRVRVEVTIAAIKADMDLAASEALREREFQVSGKSPYFPYYDHTIVFGSRAVTYRDLQLTSKLRGKLSISFGKSQTVADALPALRDTAGIHSLNLSYSNVRDDDLRHVGGLEDLRYLYLRDLPITNKGMAHLRPLRNLEILNLTGTVVSDDALKHIAMNKSMKRLGLGGVNVTGPGLEYLSEMQELMSLGIGNSKLGDSGGPHLARLRSLHLASFSRTDVGDQTLRHLANLPKLGLLDLTRTKVTDVGLESLRNNDCIYELILDDTAVTGKGLEAVSTMKQLSRLHINGVTDISPSQYAKFRENKPSIPVFSDLDFILKSQERDDDAP